MRWDTIEWAAHLLRQTLAALVLFAVAWAAGALPVDGLQRAVRWVSTARYLPDVALAAARTWTAQQGGWQALLARGRQWAQRHSAPALHVPGPAHPPLEAAAVLSGFGWRKGHQPGSEELHEGLDLAGPPGAPVHAAWAGRVAQAGAGTVLIDHGRGFTSLYSGLDRIAVQPGQAVEQGHVLGHLSARPLRGEEEHGPHLHFEVRVGGEAVDPAGFLTPRASGL